MAAGEVAIAELFVADTGELVGNGLAKAVSEFSACFVAVEHEVSAGGNTLTIQPSPTQLKTLRRFILISL